MRKNGQRVPLERGGQGRGGGKKGKNTSPVKSQLHLGGRESDEKRGGREEDTKRMDAKLKAVSRGSE